MNAVLFGSKLSRIPVSFRVETRFWLKRNLWKSMCWTTGNDIKAGLPMLPSSSTVLLNGVLVIGATTPPMVFVSTTPMWPSTIIAIFSPSANPSTFANAAPGGRSSGICLVPFGAFLSPPIRAFCSTIFSACCIASSNAAGVVCRCHPFSLSTLLMPLVASLSGVS